jgi:diguanylate cyclase
MVNKEKKMQEMEEQRLTAQETIIIIDALEKAIIEHGKWLTGWHRSLMCGLTLPSNILSKNAHQLCQFGQWYYKQTSKILNEHPDYILIEDAHRIMHETATALAKKSNDGETINKKDYDLFLEKEVHLSELLIKIRDEFHNVLFSFDSLTSVLNRQAFLRILAQEYARTFRTNQALCIAMVDLDNFKSINDKYGHQAGDKALKTVAHYLTDNLRPYDSMCRYGGEEFLVCLPHTPLNHAKSVLIRLQQGLASLPIKIEGKETIYVTGSFGVALTEEDVSMNDTITRADSAMYAAKNGGGNRVITWGDKA